MKITAGLGSIDEYVRYVKAGADEFFCGYVPYEWNQKYGTMLPLNRREVLSVNVQIGAESELQILAKLVKKYKRPVHLTFNSLFYTPEQYPEIAGIIRRCMELGFTSFIIADPALLVYLRDQEIRCEIHVSGETSEVNRKMADVFDRLHASRIIFHRKNSFEDMESVIRHEKQKGSNSVREFEAFALNELCQFSGSFCNSLHCDEMGYLCRVPYRLGNIRESDSVCHGCELDIKKEILSPKTYSGETCSEKICPGETSCSEKTCFSEKKSEIADPEKTWFRESWPEETCPDGICFKEASEQEKPADDERKYDPDGYLCGAGGCGLCALFQLKKAGITHLKLVGRGNYVDFMEKDIRNLKQALEILEDAETQKEYISRMKMRIFPYGCGENCYYPHCGTRTT